MDTKKNKVKDKTVSSRKRPRNSHSPSPVPQTKTDDTFHEERVKKIGRKTRERLNEERSKRKEIVRLDSRGGGDVGNISGIRDVDGSTRKSSKSSKFAQSIKQKTSKVSRPRPKRKLASKSSYHQNNSNGYDYKDKRTNKDKIDPWVPDIKYLTIPFENLPKEEKSNIVRLHGLPIGVKVDHIRKFFSGLDTQRIFILPSLNVTIENFDDVSHDDDNLNHVRKRNTKKGTYVERYSNHFRVFVKFQSYLVADIALARSGEAIHIDDETIAAIAISPVTKSVAVHIQKHMAIDGKRGELMEDVLGGIEEDIPKIVSELTWSMTYKELGLFFSKKTIGGSKSYPTIKTSELYHLYPPTSQQSYQKLVILYNHLLDIYEELEKECASLILMQEFDPYLILSSPKHRLTHTATNWILDQLEIIKKCLDSYNHTKK